MSRNENWATYACKEALDQCAALPEDELLRGVTLTIPCGTDESSGHSNTAAALKPGSNLNAYNAEALVVEYAILRDVHVKIIDSVCYASSSAEDISIGEHVPVTNESMASFTIEAPISNCNSSIERRTYTLPISFCQEVVTDAWEEILSDTDNFSESRDPATNTLVYTAHPDSNWSHQRIFDTPSLMSFEQYGSAENFPISGYREINSVYACVSSLGEVFEGTRNYDNFQLKASLAPTEPLADIATPSNSAATLATKINPALAQIIFKLTPEKFLTFYQHPLFDQIFMSLPIEKAAALCRHLPDSLVLELLKSPDSVTQLIESFKAKPGALETELSKLKL